MILYKYLHPDRVDILKNCLIRYTPSQAFNDPFEVKPYISKISEKADGKAMLEENLPELIRKVYNDFPLELRMFMQYDQFYELAKNEIGEKSDLLLERIESFTPMVREMLATKLTELLGILSLTERADNLLMWAHYAVSHEGFVIGFDATHPYFNDKKSPDDELRHLRKVEYRETRPALPMIELSGEDVLMVKSTQWEYEQEWRIIRPLEDADRIIQNQPYPVHLFQFPAAAVREVIFGCRMLEENKGCIIASLKSTSFQHVQISQAEPDEIEFRMKFHPVI